MTNEELLEYILVEISKKSNENFEQMEFCNQHKFTLEAAALRYKESAYADMRSIIYTAQRIIEKGE